MAPKSETHIIHAFDWIQVLYDELQYDTELKAMVARIWTVLDLVSTHRGRDDVEDLQDRVDFADKLHSDRQSRLGHGATELDQVSNLHSIQERVLNNSSP